MNDFETLARPGCGLKITTLEGSSFELTFSGTEDGFWCVTLHGPETETIETPVMIDMPVSTALRSFAYELEAQNKDAFLYSDFNTWATRDVYMTIANIWGLT